MRFQRLDIPAFGPFTNLELSFQSADHDLHVIYGANEAGKSSLLRAIRDLLFGIHGQSSDNFLHDYKKLRLVGEIVNRAGTQLTFQRRKGNRNTLLDGEGESLPGDALLPFLGGVDQGYFSAMFGLGNKELEEGAEQLLRGEGEIGDALFSASLGGTPVQQVLDSLVEESERLFKGRASTTVSIRPAVKRYKELLKLSRDAMVNPDTWSKLETLLGEQQELQNRLTKEIRGLDEQIGWLARCEDALPSVGLLSEQLESLQSLPELPDLASDFVERAQAARQAVSDIRGKVEALQNQLAQMEVEETECVPSSEFIAEAEALDLLHQALGAYRERKETLKNLRSRLAGLEPTLRQGMQSLGVEGGTTNVRVVRMTFEFAEILPVYPAP